MIVQVFVRNLSIMQGFLEVDHGLAIKGGFKTKLVTPIGDLSGIVHLRIVVKGPGGIFPFRGICKLVELSSNLGLADFQLP